MPVSRLVRLVHAALVAQSLRYVQFLSFLFCCLSTFVGVLHLAQVFVMKKCFLGTCSLASSFENSSRGGCYLASFMVDVQPRWSTQALRVFFVLEQIGFPTRKQPLIRFVILAGSMVYTPPAWQGLVGTGHNRYRQPHFCSRILTGLVMFTPLAWLVGTYIAPVRCSI